MNFISQKPNKQKLLNFVLTLGQKVLERQNIQNQTIFELYTDNNKSKYSSNPKNSRNYEKLYIKEASTAATTEFIGKIPNKKKISNEHFNLCVTYRTGIVSAIYKR